MEMTTFIILLSILFALSLFPAVTNIHLLTASGLGAWIVLNAIFHGQFGFHAAAYLEGARYVASNAINNVLGIENTKNALLHAGYAIKIALLY